MSDDDTGVSQDAFIARLKSARSAGAVVKARLILLRNEEPDALVLAFEGDDDKIIYGQWIRRVRDDLAYEPFPCGGKRELRSLKNALDRDLNGLSKGVYYFVDRDFDDLTGFSDPAGVFMTDMYSVENYLVDDQVLEALLRDEFPCHAKPAKRREIQAVFNGDYARFLELTSEVNRRIFIARRIPIDLRKRLPTGLRDLATVALGSVAAVATRPEEIVVYEREPTPEELAGLDEIFDGLDARTRYRGKFALRFFKEWLSKLADDHAKDAPVLMSDAEGSVRRAELMLSNFASKSQMPQGFSEFVHALA